tara:strand:+ start:23 stop:154 length:132 start_codon:yes stop_codon:yes gene_type:complete
MRLPKKTQSAYNKPKPKSKKAKPGVKMTGTPKKKPKTRIKSIY